MTKKAKRTISYIKGVKKKLTKSAKKFFSTTGLVKRNGTKHVKCLKVIPISTL